MKLPAQHGWTWRETKRAAAACYTTPRTIWEAAVPGMFYPDSSPVVIHAEFVDHRDQWFVSDDHGAMRTSPAPTGVKGMLMSRIEGFSDVEMSADGHFYLTVDPAPARTLPQRIQEAGMRVAAYSVFLAWAHQPPGWPPVIVLNMTDAQAAQLGVFPSH